MFGTRIKTAAQIRKSQKWKCVRKSRLTMEESAAQFGRYLDADTSIYLCPVCGFCHFGHEPKYLVEQVKQSILDYKQKRYEGSVKRQKGRFREPSWKADPRMNFATVRKTDRSGVSNG